jgi:glycosyltransferase involved in cell wall biosynthesis
LIISVNRDLEDWSKKKLYCKEVIFLPNFARDSTSVATTYLKGDENKRIICLANLKNPKNHFFLLNAFNESNIKQSGWSLHFVGSDYNDEYSLNLKSYIKENALEGQVFIYGTCSDVSFVLSQAKIGVLASTYEGFPVALLEYGLAKLSVVTTNVGYCKEIVIDSETGLLFSPNKKDELIKVLQKITHDEVFRNNVSLNLYNRVKSIYSEEKIINSVVSIYSNVISNS